MNDVARRGRVKVAPRQALDAIKRQDDKQASREATPSEIAAGSGGALSACDQPAARLDPKQNARVSARAVLLEEFAVVRGGIDRALDQTAASADRLEGIHRARRGLKRLRALRDLLRSGFVRGQGAARLSIRNAKAGLAEARQRDALALLLEELCALKGRPLTSPSIHQIAGGQVELDTQAIRDVLSEVTAAQRSMRLASGAPIDWHEITQQLALTWARARTCASQEWLGRAESWLHETRKHYQRLADQLGALALCATPQQLVARKRLRTAAEQLGRARDLGMLAEMIDQTSPEGRAVARRAINLRSRAVRIARDESRKALVETPQQMALAMSRRIARA